MAIFDDFAQSLGGAWRPAADSKLDGLLDWHRRFVRKLQQNNYLAGRPPIEFGLINSGQFNAVAGMQNGVDVIGLCLGQPLITANLFSSLLSHPEILPNVGNSSAETFRGAFDPTQRSVDVFAVAAAITSPKDPVRADYALKLGWIARYFIVEHEFYHLFNGHIDWLNKTTNFNALGEVGASAIPNLSALNLQTLEMDADCNGATHTLLTIFRARPEVCLSNPHMNTYEDATFAIHFALYCIFRIFNTKRIDLTIDMLDYGDHPPAVMRQFMIAATMHSRLFDNKSVSEFITEERFATAASGALIEAERAFLLVAGKPPHANAMAVSGPIIDKCSKDTKRLNKNWTSLRLELLPYKRGRTLSE